MTEFVNAKQATELLGISRATLYAYVSRGLLAAFPSDSDRTSRYRRADVERMATQKSRGRKPKQVARATLDWGLPVLESAITLVDNAQLFYRGVPVNALAKSATVEAVASLLWQFDEKLAFPQSPPKMPSWWSGYVKTLSTVSFPQRCLALFAAADAVLETPIWQNDLRLIARCCGDLLRVMMAIVIGKTPSSAPLHRQCQRAWQLTDKATNAVRIALIVCADHELNASCFTARCVASTGASIGAAISAGLAALSGPLHGGTAARIEAMWDELNAASSIQQGLHRRLTRGDPLVGFGHPLYPDGDIRAAQLLAALPAHKETRAILQAAEKLAGQKPSIDFALVALRRQLDLPEGAAFGLFAAGRTIGWIAHTLEQRAQAQLIRPRAAYIGVTPNMGAKR